MMPIGSIVIPAHNEERVLGRLLRALSGESSAPTIELVVVANGCTDQTSRVARGFSGVRVLERGTSSKQAALNAGDDATDIFPRLYVDADIELTRAAAITTLGALAQRGALAARPPLRYVTEECTKPVQRFYGARARTPSLMSALWGAGIYGVSRAGRARWRAFPVDEADDLFVDRLFNRDEVQIVDTDHALVRVPRNIPALVHTLRRVYRQSASGLAGSSASSLSDLVYANRSPLQWTDLGTYVAVAALGRARSPEQATAWQRDETSR